MALVIDVVGWSATKLYTESTLLVYQGSMWLALANNVDSEPFDGSPDWDLVIQGSGGGSGGIQTFSVTLEEDDLNDNTNPVTLVEGVEGKIIVPISFASTFNFVDNVYTTNDAAQFDASIGGVEIIAPLFFIDGFTDDPTSQVDLEPVGSNNRELSATMEGQPLVCATTGTVTEDDPGSSTVTVNGAYYLIDAT